MLKRTLVEIRYFATIDTPLAKRIIEVYMADAVQLRKKREELMSKQTLLGL